MKYFGTDLETPGHYIFDLDGETIHRIGLNFKNLPFDPEGLTQNLLKGEVVFYQGGGYTVIGISGSCSDNRQGTKSIFWVERIITFNELKDEIMKNHISITIMESMPFKILWPKLLN